MLVRTLLSVAIVFAFAFSIKAEPITIQTGQLILQSNDISSNEDSSTLATRIILRISNNDYSFNFATENVFGTTLTNLDTVLSQTSQIGDTVNASIPFDTFTVFPTDIRGVSTTPNGTDILAFASNFNFNINVSNFVLTPSLSVTIPFTMTGTFDVCGIFSGCGNNFEITGNGNVTYTFAKTDVRNPNSPYRIKNVTYTFASPTPDPVPEPTTLLLLATGIAGIGGYASRRKNKSDEN